MRLSWPALVATTALWPGLATAQAACSGVPLSALGACLSASDELSREAARERAEEDNRRRQAEAVRAQRDRREEEQERIDAERRAAQIEQDRKDRAEYARSLKDPQTYVDRIHDLRQRIVLAQRAIARERRIGATSGFVNRQTLYQAGELIEQAREAIAKSYQEYRRVGGRKPLSAL